MQVCHRLMQAHATYSRPFAAPLFHRRRDAHMNYNLKSKMAMNVMQSKKSSSSTYESRGARSGMQTKQMYMD